jgi:hypothetical protein
VKQPQISEQEYTHKKSMIRNTSVVLLTQVSSKSQGGR